MRLIAFITVCFLATLLPLPLTLALFVVYVSVYEGVELLFLAIAIDSYFGHTAAYPVYMVWTAAFLLISIWVKPRLLLYNS